MSEDEYDVTKTIKIRGGLEVKTLTIASLCPVPVVRRVGDIVATQVLQIHTEAPFLVRRD